VAEVEVGRRAAPFTVPVERGKVREFARATKARRTSYLTDTHAVAPPTWLAAASFWIEPENHVLGGVFDYSRTLHAGQEYVFPGVPPRAGDTLTGQQRVESVYRKQGRRGGELTFTVLLTEYRDAAGTLVAEVRQTIVETERAAQ
jgi:hypothetical protein